MSANEKVIRPLELFFYIVGVIFLFIIFFPKYSLEKLVLKENKNYYLAVKYLKGLIKASSKNPDFVIYLIKYELKLGHLVKAAFFIKKYSSNPYYLNNLSFLKIAYYVYKSLFFKRKDDRFLNIAKYYLRLILLKGAYEFVYKEAKSLNLVDLEAIALKKLYTKSLNYSKDYESVLYRLKKYDDLVKFYDYEYKVTNDLEYLRKKLNILLYDKKDYRAYEIYLKLFNKTKDIEYFKKAINVLIYYHKLNLAFLLLKYYEVIFLKDKNIKALKFILKKYLELNRLKDAKNLSKKILRITS